MNENIQAWLLATLERVTAVTERGLDVAGNAIGKGAEFVAGELPKFVQEFIVFNMVWHWSVVLVGLAILGASLYLWYRLHTAVKDKDWSEGPWVFVYVLPVPLVILGFNLIALHIQTALMVTFAPRIFLLTEFMKFFGK